MSWGRSSLAGPGSGRLVVVGAVLGGLLALAEASRAVATPKVLGAAAGGALLGWCAWAALSGGASAVRLP